MPPLEALGAPLRWRAPQFKNDCHNRILMVEEVRQNRGTALAENPTEVEVETLEQHQKGDTSTSRGNRTQSRPVRRWKSQLSSRLTSWAHEGGDPNRKGGQSQKQRPQTDKLDVEQQLVPRRHHRDKNKQEGGSLNPTEMRPKSGAESEPETRIAKLRKKIVSHVTQREIYPTARDKGTGGEGRSDSGDQRVNKCEA